MQQLDFGMHFRLQSVLPVSLPVLAVARISPLRTPSFAAAVGLLEDEAERCYHLIPCLGRLFAVEERRGSDQGSYLCFLAEWESVCKV